MLWVNLNSFGSSKWYVTFPARAITLYIPMYRGPIFHLLQKHTTPYQGETIKSERVFSDPESFPIGLEFSFF